MPVIRLAVVLLAILTVMLTGGPAQAAVRHQAVILVAASPDGGKLLDPLAQELAVAGYALRRLAPRDEPQSLESLARRLEQEVVDLGHLPEIGEISLLGHGAGGLAVLAYLQDGRPSDKVTRALLLAPPMADIQKGAPWHGLRLGYILADGEKTGAGQGTATLPGQGHGAKIYHVAASPLDLPQQEAAQKIVFNFLKLSTSTSPGLACLLVADTSGSLKRNHAYRLRDQAIKQVLALLQPGDQAGLVSFDTQARVRLPLTMLSEQAQVRRVARGLDKLPVKGDTDLSAGLRLAGRLLEKAASHHRRAVVVLSDGRNDPASADGPTLQAARRLVEQGATLHTIGLGGGEDRGLMSRLAVIGGGLYLQAKAARDLSGAGELIQAHLAGLVPLAAARGNTPIKLSFWVDSSVRFLDLGLESSGRPVLKLHDPSGRLARARELGYGPGSRHLLLKAPQVGHWRLEIPGPARSEVRVRVSAQSNLRVEPVNGGEPPTRGRPWRLVLAVKQEGLPVRRSLARLSVQGPDGVEQTFNSDNQGPDSFSPDQGQAGFVSFSLPGWPKSGPLLATAWVEGYNRRGERFQRMLTHTSQVMDSREGRP